MSSEVRDELIHRNARTIVIPEPQSILFRILQPRSIEKLAIPAVMFNDAVVDFVPYASLLLRQDGMDAQQNSGSSAQSFWVMVKYCRGFVEVIPD